LDLVADSCVGLCDILGVDPGLRAVGVGVGYLRVRREQVLVDVLVELLRSRSPTLMLLMLIR
jgi:Holliday junction resolvasome RuvABC endonuclease subunit